MSEICFTHGVPVAARESQMRVVYSLLKPAVRAAAAFRLPIRPLLDLLRLAYYEHLHRSGMTTEQIAAHFGQTSRHMRSLAQRLDSGFFDAERDDGLAREIEALAGSAARSDEELAGLLPAWSGPEIDTAVGRLLADGRLERGPGGALRAARRYVIMRDDRFHHRIDSLNHFLDAAYRAIRSRVVEDQRERSLMKTISFSATKDDLKRWIARLEGDLRRDLADIDEAAEFQGEGDQRYLLCFGLARKRDDSTPE